VFLAGGKGLYNLLLQCEGKPWGRHNLGVFWLNFDLQNDGAGGYKPDDDEGYSLFALHLAHLQFNVPQPLLVGIDNAIRMVQVAIQLCDLRILYRLGSGWRLTLKHKG
jgi:hypothetical protein